MDDKLAPLVKRGGAIVIAIPGVKNGFDSDKIDEMKPFWSQDDAKLFHSCEWWEDILMQSKSFKLESIREFEQFEQVWDDWLKCDNEHAVGDREMIKANDGKFMNIVLIVGKRV